MQQNQLYIQYPQQWLDMLHLNKSSFEDEAKMAMAAKLFELKRLSSGMPADNISAADYKPDTRARYLPEQAAYFSDSKASKRVNRAMPSLVIHQGLF